MKLLLTVLLFITATTVNASDLTFDFKSPASNSNGQQSLWNKLVETSYAR